MIVLDLRWLPDLHQTVIDEHAIMLTDTGAFIGAVALSRRLAKTSRPIASRP